MGFTAVQIRGSPVVAHRSRRHLGFSGVTKDRRWGQGGGEIGGDHLKILSFSSPPPNNDTWMASRSCGISRRTQLTARILDDRHTRDRRPHQLSTNYLPGLECLLRSQAATLILGSTTRPHYMNQVAVLMLAAMAS